jgi:hypothetical protein
LAEGEILVHGEPKPVSEYLLGQGGPLFTVDQRRWITQLAERPLRLYDVTDVVPGQQLTLCDSLDAEAPPIIVREKSGSQASPTGNTDRRTDHGRRWPLRIVWRCIRVYAFFRAGRSGENARGHGSLPGQACDLPHLLSSIIQRQWLAQFFRSDCQCRPSGTPTPASPCC